MKLYKREGKKFVETINPVDRIGMYVDNSGLSFTKDKMQSSVGKCVMIENGHYVIACIEDYYKKLTFKEALRYTRYKCRMYQCYDAFIPSIGLLFYTACKYPELFDKHERYMSSNLFHRWNSGRSLVRSLIFNSSGQYWNSSGQYWGTYVTGSVSRLSIKLFYKIPITS